MGARIRRPRGTDPASRDRDSCTFFFVRNFASCLVALASVACTALNPAFGDENARGEGSNDGDGSGLTAAGTTERDPETNGGTGPAGTSPSGTTSNATDTSDTAPGSDTASEDSSTGPTTPNYTCDEEGFDIQLTRPGIDCETLPAGQGINVSFECMIFSETDTGLTAAPATGCEKGACVPSAPAGIAVSVPGVDLAGALEVGDSPCGYLWARGTVVAGECRWGTLSLFRANEEFALILGGGIGDNGEETFLPLPGGGGNVPVVPYSAATLGPTTCGGRTDEFCAAAGWKEFRFSETQTAAAPDGVPGSAIHGDQDLTIFNWGLQLDRQCDMHGRWAVVEAGQEWVLD